MSSNPPVDLTNCDREPIHIPGSIQPHGGLIACDETLLMVLRHSQNVPAMLGVAPEMNDRPLAALIGEDQVHDLRNAMTTAIDPARPSLMLDVPLGPTGTRFNIALHRHDGASIIEFEPAGAAPGHAPLETARMLIGRLSKASGYDALIRDTARLLKAALGYDRVMIYRFMPDGSGQVIAEAKNGALESFLGQFFPSSDIPQQARALYLKSMIRMVSDASGARVGILPDLDRAGRPLDLSFAHLRSVSPIHCEYLRNMGVGASMSVSIVVDGVLWGLIACHHYAPRALSMSERVSAEVFGEFFCLHLQMILRKERLEAAATARRFLDELLLGAAHVGDVGGLLRDHLPELGRLIESDGVGLLIDGRWHAHGATPPASAVPEIAAHLNAVAKGRAHSTESLCEGLASACDYAADAAGLLAVPLSQIPRDYLMFFRKELVQTLEWGGNPEKTYETGPLGDRLTPRKSFAIWKQTVEGRSNPWSAAERDVAEAARLGLVEVVLRHSELLASERRQAELQQKMLNEELNHRVKNILALIRSLVSQPIAEGATLTGYVEALKGRIQALAYAHDQVIRSEGGGSLGELVAAELSPYQGQGARISVAGGDLRMNARAFSVMALVIHELSTNAAKYGALAAPGGSLSVSWRPAEDGGAEIDWRETRAGPMPPPSPAGFGSMLIRRSVPFDLGGKSAVELAPEGLKAHFHIPATHVDWNAAMTARPQLAAAAASGAGLAGLDVLLVEDQMLIALDAESILESAGVGRIVTCTSADEALKALDGFTPGFAMLDINLGSGRTSLPVAEALKARGIPFVFATGYNDMHMVPEALRGVPVVRKPYEGKRLLESLSAITAEAAGA